MDRIAAMKNMPLVSVVVVTYNSSHYVAETLDSIRMQDYGGPLELIISDDGSTDDTVAICRNWTDANRAYFSRIKQIHTPRNLGICGNYNFALNYVTGIWIKYIAGDDILRHDAIRRYVEDSQLSDDGIIVCGTLLIDGDGGEIGPRYLMEDLLNTQDPYEQARNMALAGHGIVEGPTFFIKTSLMRQMGGMDLRYPMLEDFPFAFRCAFAGHHIHVIEDTLVKYRVYPDSVSQADDAFHDLFYGALYDARMTIAKKEHDWLFWWHALVQKKLLNPSQNKLEKILKDMYLLSDIWMHVRRIKRHV